DVSILAAFHAATAAFQAVYCAYEATWGGSEGVAERCQAVAYEAAAAGAHAAQAACALDLPLSVAIAANRLGAAAFARAMARDYQKLVDRKLGKFPERGEAIDPSETGPLGPLWPEGEPDWYREGLARGEWQSIAQVREELRAAERAAQMTPPYEQLRERV